LLVAKADRVTGIAWRTASWKIGMEQVSMRSKGITNSEAEAPKLLVLWLFESQLRSLSMQFLAALEHVSGKTHGFVSQLSASSA
jgi:hypothetical protein